jgi:hypothetical protein
MRVRFGAAIAALAIVAVAACGDDGGGSSPTTTEAPQELTTDEWIEEADAICADFRAEVEAIDQPSGNPTDVNITDRQLSDFADYLDAVIPNLESAHEQTAALGTPADIADDVESLQTLRADSIDATQRAADAAREGDNVGFRSAWEDILDNEAEIDTVSQDLDLEVCGQDGTEDPSGKTIPAAQWTDEVLAICEAQTETFSSIPEPSVPQDEVTAAELPEVATFLRAGADVYTDTIGEVNQVGSPEGAESDAADFVDALGGIATAFYDSADVADTGDVEAWRVSFDAATSALADLGSIAQDLGVEACTQ